jgi:HNH endonuclease
MTKSRGIIAPRQPWTAAEESILADLYPDIPCADVAALLGRKRDVVYKAAERLGLQKSDYFKASDMSGRVSRSNQNPRMIATRFQPGLVPWNKGSHFVAGGRSAETRFKAGRKPQESHNYLPIGSLRISKDGYLQRKVTDDQSLYPADRWQFVHRQVWEAAHGPIPAGHMVAFRKGQFTNRLELLTVDRLECISRAENALRNSLWKQDPEMMHLHHLKGQIKRQVNRINKESQHV